MPQAENSNDRAYLHTMTVMSDAEQILAAMKDHLKTVIARAFAEFPLNSSASAKLRWQIIGTAMERARDSLNAVIDIGFDSYKAGEEKCEAKAANDDGDKEAVLQFVGCYLRVYERVIKREAL